LDLKKQLETLHGVPQLRRELTKQRVPLQNAVAVSMLIAVDCNELDLCLLLSDASSSPAGNLAIVVQMRNGQRLNIETNLSKAVLNLKSSVLASDGIPVQEQHMFFKGKLLEYDVLLGFYKLKEGSCVDFMQASTLAKRPKTRIDRDQSRAWKQMTARLEVVELEMLSSLPMLSRHTQMRLEDLKEESPRDVMVRRLFLSSIATHRSHLMSNCPKPPCNHFAPKVRLEVVKVKRLLSRGLLDMFLVRRERVEGLHKTGCSALPADFPKDAVKLRSIDDGLPNLNEYYLYHGSSHETIDEITRGGFDPRRGGETTGQMFGRARYFAPNASKADFYAQANDDGICCMIVARVCLKATHLTKTSMPEAVRPPNAPGSTLPCDSVIAATRSKGGCVDLPEAMIYSEGQALPEYLIYYRHADACVCHWCAAGAS
jgi:hypothetical protein